MRRGRAGAGTPPEWHGGAFADVASDICWVCARPLGTRVERHHPIPKSRGGRGTVPVHPICHRTMHATYTNAELARMPTDPPALGRDERIGRFLAWVAGKPADFNAPTRKAR